MRYSCALFRQIVCEMLESLPQLIGSIFRPVRTHTNAAIGIA